VALAPKKQSVEEQLVDQIARFYDDPLGYVMFNWDWENDTSIQIVELVEPWRSRYGCKYGPDKWACEFLEQWGAEIRKRGFTGKAPVPPIQFSTASGHGIGKSVLVAWAIKFIMDTRPFAKGTVTANTDVQLRTKTWATLGAWHSKSLTAHWCDFNTGRGAMSLRNKQAPNDWFTTAQTCREENSESFAGQHAANSTSFYVFDEASGIPDKIFEVRKGGLMTGEPMVLDFGNPTRNSGAFFENTVGKQRHRYIVRQIDAREVAITNKLEQQKMIDDYGIDSDIVKVRVLGQFPSTGDAQFIPTADVEAAMEREVSRDPTAALVIGVDVARFGDDDSVIYPRIGMDARSFPARRYQGLDTVQLVGKVIETIRYFRGLGMECAGLFIDGGGVGGGVVDQLRALGYNPIEVQFGGGATDKQTYRFKADEMWGNLRDALHTRLVLPARGEDNAQDLKDQLTQREYGYTIQGNKIHLESKADMKKRGLSSPDVADALALTFAMEVAPVSTMMGHNGGPKLEAQHDYDPYEDARG
jgi:hypothetical protein